jgi:hypothetical protein
LIATTSIELGEASAALKNRRPMRPKPLIPTRTPPKATPTRALGSAPEEEGIVARGVVSEKREETSVVAFLATREHSRTFSVVFAGKIG